MFILKEINQNFTSFFGLNLKLDLKTNLSQSRL